MPQAASTVVTQASHVLCSHPGNKGWLTPSAGQPAVDPMAVHTDHEIFHSLHKLTALGLMLLSLLRNNHVPDQNLGFWWR